MKHFAILAALAVIPTLPAAAAIYLPADPQLNVALSSITGGGWTQCYAAPMATFLGTYNGDDYSW